MHSHGMLQIEGTALTSGLKAFSDQTLKINDYYGKAF